MKTKIILWFCILVSLNAFSQKKLDADFTKFKSYFDTNKVVCSEDSNKTYLPIDLLTRITGKSYENVVRIRPVVNTDDKGNQVFIVHLSYPEGGASCVYQLLLFADNIFLDIKNIGFIMLDAEGGIVSSIRVINSGLFEVEEKTVEYTDEWIEKILKKKWVYYFVDNKQIRIAELSIPSKGRLYPQSLLRIIDIEKLREMKKENLDIMRNEIFADYGYVFKSEKWKKYFETREWYNPRYKEVDSKLSIVEKVNIDRILNIRNTHLFY